MPQPAFSCLLVIVCCLYLASATAASKELDVIGELGVCHLTTPGPIQENQGMAAHSFAPVADAAVYLAKFRNRADIYDYINKPGAQVKATVVHPPRHGLFKDVANYPAFIFHPEPGFLGKDRAEVLATIAKETVKIVYFIRVIPSIGNYGYEFFCPGEELWDRRSPTASVNEPADQLSPAIVRAIEQQYADACEASENPRSYPAVLTPGLLVLRGLDKRWIAPKGAVQTKVSIPPAHGKVTVGERDNVAFPGSPNDYFQYTPTPGFFGDDHVTFDIAVNGSTVRISYLVKVVREGESEACLSEEERNGDGD